MRLPGNPPLAGPEGASETGQRSGGLSDASQDESAMPSRGEGEGNEQEALADMASERQVGTSAAIHHGEAAVDAQAAAAPRVESDEVEEAGGQSPGDRLPLGREARRASRAAHRQQRQAPLVTAAQRQAQLVMDSVGAAAGAFERMFVKDDDEGGGTGGARCVHT